MRLVSMITFAPMKKLGLQDGQEIVRPPADVELKCQRFSDAEKIE
jgi:hypothetical protein